MLLLIVLLFLATLTSQSSDHFIWPEHVEERVDPDGILDDSGSYCRERLQIVISLLYEAIFSRSPNKENEGV